MNYYKTYFSFRYGAYSTPELIEAAVEKRATALALTNINSTYDIWEFAMPGKQVSNLFQAWRYAMRITYYIFSSQRIIRD